MRARPTPRTDRLPIAVAAVVAALTGAACGTAPPAERAGPARRVVSLSPAFTELLFAIGAGDRVVGRTAWCDTPAEALAVPSVGDGLAPNVEAVLARTPDLVVLYASGSNVAATERLAALGVPTRTLPMDRLDHVPAAARTLGRATATWPRADSLAAAFELALDSARMAAQTGGPVPRVLLLAWNEPPIVIGGGSFQTELVTLAGGVNVFGDLPQPSAQVTIEAIAARDPDLVVLLDADGLPGWAERPEWSAVRAVRERRFLPVRGPAFARPSLHALDAVRTLQRALARAVP
jgi:ABC-type Fe3+-hydroxamate transport system substrate-binding protein